MNETTDDVEVIKLNGINAEVLRLLCKGIVKSCILCFIHGKWTNRHKTDNRMTQTTIFSYGFTKCNGGIGVKIELVNEDIWIDNEKS